MRNPAPPRQCDYCWKLHHKIVNAVTVVKLVNGSCSGVCTAHLTAHTHLMDIMKAAEEPAPR
ncbi:hypothetical protein [Rhodococcus sp. 11-3]|uniref:hypothetical protein n=1 Tax=Rhodococcus sp. 11-3 TaxID=2854796 RepID=UPI00203B34CF|nr:hypothetical protein [Rhodococcus sp. 11-3]USC17066.1 hypothetical protein KZJ41_09440 [Rhodococcus sp. 11-3]